MRCRVDNDQTGHKIINSLTVNVNTVVGYNSFLKNEQRCNFGVEQILPKVTTDNFRQGPLFTQVTVN